MGGHRSAEKEFRHAHQVFADAASLPGAYGPPRGRLYLARLDDATALGCRTIRLGTLHEMTAAQALYRRLGFVQIPRYRPDEMIDTLFFERRLTP